MKITIATGLYPPEIGGPSTYARMLEEGLPPRGFEVSIVPFGWVRHYPKIIRHFVFAWKLWKESKNSEVIYALDPISVGLPAFFIAKIRRKPLLIRLGGDYAWEQGRQRFGIEESLDEYLELKKVPIMVSVFAKIQTFVCSKAKMVVVPSHYLKGVVKKWGIDDKKIQVIYSALFPIEVSSSKEKLREEFEYNYPTIVSAGRLVPWKGFEALVDVVKELKNKYPQVTLIILGDGKDKEKLETKVADLKLSQHVWFTGDVSKETLGATIKAADVFVLNTAYEGLSHQLIEVMDLGTPIITTTAGGNTELISDGIEGLLVEFNNKEQIKAAIERVLNHPESQERMTQSARARSKQFGKFLIIDETIETLNKINDEKSS